MTFKTTQMQQRLENYADFMSSSYFLNIFNNFGLMNYLTTHLSK